MKYETEYKAGPILEDCQCEPESAAPETSLGGRGDAGRPPLSRHTRLQNSQDLIRRGAAT